MNAIGIDFGRTATSIRLREKVRSQTCWQNIDDGKRLLIPNAFDAENRWASQAIAANSSTLEAGFIEPVSGTWIEERTVAPFLAGLVAQIISFLGRVRPTRQNGFDVVLAPHSVDYGAAEHTIMNLGQERLSHALVNAVCVPPTRALLCRWAAEKSITESMQIHAIVVHVGDTQSTVTAYDVAFGDGGSRIIESHAGQTLPELGSFSWEAALVRQMAERGRFEVTIPVFADIMDAVRQMAVKLRQADKKTRVRPPNWLADRMYLVTEFSRAEMVSSLIEISATVVPLTRLVALALKSAPICNQIEIVVGGTGAYWPFAYDSLVNLFGSLDAKVWQSSDPREDVARGAALWPLFSPTATPIWKDQSSETAPTVPPSPIPPPEPTPDMPPELSPEPSNPTVSSPTEFQPASGYSLTDWVSQPPAD